VSALDNPVTVDITILGVKGDEQADLSVHGGIEKASMFIRQNTTRFGTNY
jgi:MOSC domain-containing protein YiiM